MKEDLVVQVQERPKLHRASSSQLLKSVSPTSCEKRPSFTRPKSENWVGHMYQPPAHGTPARSIDKSRASYNSHTRILSLSARGSIIGQARKPEVKWDPEPKEWEYDYEHPFSGEYVKTGTFRAQDTELDEDLKSKPLRSINPRGSVSSVSSSMDFSLLWPPKQSHKTIASLLNAMSDKAPNNKLVSDLKNKEIQAAEEEKESLQVLAEGVVRLFGGVQDTAKVRSSLAWARSQTCTCATSSGECNLEFMAAFYSCEGFATLEQLLSDVLLSRDPVTEATSREVVWICRALYRWDQSLVMQILGCQAGKKLADTRPQSPRDFEWLIDHIHKTKPEVINDQVVFVLLELFCDNVSLKVDAKECGTPELMNQVLTPDSIKIGKSVFMACEMTQNRRGWDTGWKGLMLLFADLPLGKQNFLEIFTKLPGDEKWQNWVFPQMTVNQGQGDSTEGFEGKVEKFKLCLFGVTSNLHYHPLTGGENMKQYIPECLDIYQSLLLLKSEAYGGWTNWNSGLFRQIMDSTLKKIANRAQSFTKNFNLEEADAPHWQNFFLLLNVAEEYLFFSPIQIEESMEEEMGLHFDLSESGGPLDAPLVDQIVISILTLKLAKANANGIRNSKAIGGNDLVEQTDIVNKKETKLKYRGAAELQFWLEVQAALKNLTFENKIAASQRSAPNTEDVDSNPPPCGRNHLNAKSTSAPPSKKASIKTASGGRSSVDMGESSEPTAVDVDDVMEKLTKLLKQRSYAKKLEKKLKSGKIRVPRPPIPQAIGKKTMRWIVTQANRVHKNSRRYLEINLETLTLVIAKPTAKNEPPKIQHQLKPGMITTNLLGDKDNSLALSYFANGRLLRSKEECRLIFESLFERERVYRLIRKHFMEEEGDDKGGSHLSYAKKYDPQPTPIHEETQRKVEKLDVKKTLADGLHDSWIYNKAEQGWVEGEVFDPVAKKDPQMAKFDKLKPSDQEYDISSANFLVASIFELGYTIEVMSCRTCGKTGHRIVDCKNCDSCGKDHDKAVDCTSTQAARAMEGWRECREEKVSEALPILVEFLAENSHESWADSKKKKGFSWGEKNDPSALTHPMFLPYSEMKEEEKDMDRDAAQTILSTLNARGFLITKNKKKAEDLNDDGT